jgi:hypothetical protein
MVFLSVYSAGQLVAIASVSSSCASDECLQIVGADGDLWRMLALASQFASALFLGLSIPRPARLEEAFEGVFLDFIWYVVRLLLSLAVTIIFIVGWLFIGWLIFI